MSTHFQLIPWTELCHAIDLIRYEEDNKATMTYAQLQKFLETLTPEQLNNEVVIYDKDVEDCCKADANLIIKNDKIYIGI